MGTEELLKNNAHAIMNADTEYDAQEMLKNVIQKVKEDSYQKGYEAGLKVGKLLLERLSDEILNNLKQTI